MPSPLKRPRWFTWFEQPDACPDPALCTLTCTAWEDPFECRRGRKFAYEGRWCGMQVVHPIKIAVNGEWATTDSLSLTVGEILGMFGLEGFRLKNMRSGTEYFNFDQSIFLSWGDEFLTPNDGHHGYDVAKFRRQQQAPDAESKL